MKYFYLLFILLFSSTLWAQNMLVVEKPGTVKNYIYQAGDHISIKTTEGVKISGPINIIRNDSSFVVDYVHELQLSDVEVVYKSRALLNMGGTALIGGSALYLGLDLINHGGVKIDQSFWIAVGVAAAGVIMKVFAKKKMHVHEVKWRIKVLIE